MQHYFITGLPRSRTAWLANLFTVDRSFCYHEAAAYCSGVSDFVEMLKHPTVEYVGDSDPAIGLVAKSVLGAFRTSKFLFISRTIEESFGSEYAALTSDRIPTDKEKLRELIERTGDGLSWLWKTLPQSQRLLVDYYALDDISVARKIWDFCLPNVKFDESRCAMLQNMRVTQNMEQVYRKVGNRFSVWLNNETVLERATVK